MMDNFLWKASEDKINQSNIFKFCQYLDKKNILPLTKNYAELWKWSVGSLDVFWSAFWDFSNIQGTKGKKIYNKDSIFYESRFFSDAKLNFAKNLLVKKIMKLQFILGVKMGTKNLLLGIIFIIMFVNYPIVYNLWVYTKMTV